MIATDGSVKSLYSECFTIQNLKSKILNPKSQIQNGITPKTAILQNTSKFNLI